MSDLIMEPGPSDDFDFDAFLAEEDRQHGPVKSSPLDSRNDMFNGLDMRHVYSIGIDSDGVVSTLPSQERLPTYDVYLKASEKDGIIDLLAAAAKKGTLTEVAKLYEELDVVGLGMNLDIALDKPLCEAIDHRHIHIVKHLLQHGAKVNHRHAYAALENKDTMALQTFLDAGWNIDEAEEGFGEPPMWYVRSISHRMLQKQVCVWMMLIRSSRIIEDLSLVSWFLAHGANPNASNWLDISPISRAVDSAPFSTIKLLFAHGGSATTGQLLHHAIFRKKDDVLDVLEYLLQKGAHKVINNIEYQNAPKYLVQSLFTIGTPLHDAMRSGNFEIVQLLLKWGAHPLIRDTLVLTAAERADMEGHTEMAAFLRPISDAAEPLEPQFTDSYRAPGWERWGKQFRRGSRL